MQVMLAKPYVDQSVDGWLISEKLDGVRPAYKAQAATPRAKAAKPKPQPLTQEPGVFMHAARAPVTGGGQYDNQRRFGGHNVIANNPVMSKGALIVTMFRDANADTAELEIEMRNYRMFCSEARITLTADELQTLACALIDAAHDLRTRPASSYQQGGAA